MGYRGVIHRGLDRGGIFCDVDAGEKAKTLRRGSLLKGRQEGGEKIKGKRTDERGIENAAKKQGAGRKDKDVKD